MSSKKSWFRALLSHNKIATCGASKNYFTMVPIFDLVIDVLSFLRQSLLSLSKDHVLRKTLGWNTPYEVMYKDRTTLTRRVAVSS